MTKQGNIIYSVDECGSAEPYIVIDAEDQDKIVAIALRVGANNSQRYIWIDGSNIKGKCFKEEDGHSLYYDLNVVGCVVRELIETDQKKITNFVKKNYKE